MKPLNAVTSLAGIPVTGDIRRHLDQELSGFLSGQLLVHGRAQRGAPMRASISAAWGAPRRCRSTPAGCSTSTRHCSFRSSSRPPDPTLLPPLSLPPERIAAPLFICGPGPSHPAALCRERICSGRLAFLLSSLNYSTWDPEVACRTYQPRLGPHCADEEAAGFRRLLTLTLNPAAPGALLRIHAAVCPPANSPVLPWYAVGG